MEVNNVSFSYKNSSEVIRRMSAAIEPGQITTIIGPNGSGKSTLLSLMARNAAPSAGQIVLDGRDIASYKPKALARKLAVVHQHNDAPPDLTVERLVAYGRMPYRSMFAQSAKEDAEAIEWALCCTKLTADKHRRLNELSGGQRQRAWIAMALAQRTQMLFLDEPTTYLDMYYQLEALDLVRSLNRDFGLTIVMVLHDVNQAARFSDHIMVLKEGQLVREGVPEEVLTAEVMEAVYGVKAVVRRDDESGLYLIPLSTI